MSIPIRSERSVEDRSPMPNPSNGKWYQNDAFNCTRTVWMGSAVAGARPS